MLGIMSGGVALAAEYQFTFLTHAGEENSFWAAVYRGAQDAANPTCAINARN
ncbi:MAG: hypothetical protein PHI00_05915 [Atribacterota bacterium]|jgi:hypothetical protein|nr:hypothetical protein [Atribacterota bacterium]